MLLYLVNFMSVCLSTLCQFWLVRKLIPMRYPYLYVWAGTAFQMLLWTLNNYILPEPTATIDTIVILSSFIFSWLFAKQGYRMRAILAVVVYVLAIILGNYAVSVVAYPIAESLGYSAAVLNDGNSYAYMIMCMVCTITLCPVMYLFYLLLKHIFAPNNFSRWAMLFLPILVSQVLLLNIINRILPASGHIIGVSYTLILAILLCIAADICFFIGVHKIQLGKLLEDQVRESGEQLNTQVSYYRQMQDNILHINQIRHDLNNQLQAAYFLLEKGEKDQVRCQLDQLQNNLKSKVGPQFCANLMVDAVIADKARLCQEKGIQLDINTYLPAELPIENAHLCSAFSNLLDNSIQGTLESASEGKTIELRASLLSDCLIIHCSNPALEPKQKKKEQNVLRHHGLGLDILKRIADEYAGALDIEYKNGKFETSLLLHFQYE